MELFSIPNETESSLLLPDNQEEKSFDDSVDIKKRLGLRNSITMVIGAIIGTGIFASPKGVLNEAGSLGMAMVIWSACGIIAMMGALCYMELGATYPKSGGTFVYLQMFFGELPAFLYLWVCMMIMTPASAAITALTFANYVLEPLFPTCPVPQDALRIVAALIICLLTYINCRNVDWVTRVQDVFTFSKISALIIIILLGIYQLLSGHTENFENAFQGSTRKPGHIALSFYSGLYSYSGWAFLNFVAEEIKDPFKNWPRAIYISLPLVTIIYVLVNIAYFAVLTPGEILSSNAVAVSFGGKILGVMWWIMPFSVALSTFGGLNGHTFSAARLVLAGAREGHLPNFLSMINLHYFTPVPSLVFLCITSVTYLATTKVYVLINYTIFVDALFLALSVTGMIWLRIKKPDIERPIKVNILLPIAFLIVCIFLVALPFYVSPWETGIGIAITLAGIPVYMVTIHWQQKPKVYKNVSGKITSLVQKLLLSVPEEKSY